MDDASRHLKTLEAAGLVRVGDTSDGRQRLYQLDTTRIIDIAGGWIERFDDITPCPTGPART